MEKDIIEKAVEFFNSNSKQDCYDFVIEVLYRLEESGFCIWQTYTKKDIEMITGKKPVKQKMQELGEQLQNFFEYYYNG